ncbi:HAD family hydrolase [Mesorhizobium sp. CGMCC 1.15528]|uniref:HAD family hydrolase n=1 Tax=Mesorhizobium zhangyense TaxID=1776730 RepID=A0A7C9VEL7_9HYPH|nr:HAD family hydrolase [Mesorhizobium zhangyense]NGN42831.1 HAD family hydrolase [Mesorhizobium zhangyense]
MTTPKLVIFDCDGILVDTERPANEFMASVLTQRGFPVTYEECRRRFVGRSLVSVQQEIEATGITIGNFVDDIYAELPRILDGVQAIPHVETFIQTVEAAGIPFCVASSGKPEKMQMTLGGTGLLPYFEHAMFSATMVERGKPFPDLFLHAAKQMGFAPADCIVIEDTVAGVTAGVSAGMRVFAYHGDPHSDRDGMAAAGGILFDDMRALSGLIPIA